MTKLLWVFMMVIGLSVLGCGEQPEPGTDDGGSADVTDEGGHSAPVDGGRDDAGSDDVANDEGHGSVMGDVQFSFETPDLAVGQWIEYGADDMTETVKISIVDTEMNQGTECYWVQFSGPGFAAQLLVDPAGIQIASNDYQQQMDVFFADPAEYIRTNMGDADQMANMFGNEQSMQMMLELIRAIRIVKFDQGGGAIMAIDMAGVPEFLEEQLADPSFQESFQQGFMQGFNAEQGEEGLNEMMAELDNMEFKFTETSVEAGGRQVDGVEFSIDHPEISISAVISNQLPIVPLAYASVWAADENESHSIQVRGFGMTGAENLLPGEPMQTIPAMMFLQGMTQQMGAMQSDGQGRR